MSHQSSLEIQQVIEAITNQVKSSIQSAKELQENFIKQNETVNITNEVFNKLEESIHLSVARIDDVYK